MSKLVTGSVKIGSLDDVRMAAARLDWVCQDIAEVGPLKGCRIEVPRDEGAYYRPYIDVFMIDGQWTMTFDHMMGLAPLGRDNLDHVTRAVTGKFKQALAMVQMEALLEREGAQWSTITRADGAHVLTVSR